MNEPHRPRVKYVIGPDGSPLTIADLPPPTTKRWVIRRKAGGGSAVGCRFFASRGSRPTLSLDCRGFPFGAFLDCPPRPRRAAPDAHPTVPPIALLLGGIADPGSAIFICIAASPICLSSGINWTLTLNWANLAG